MCCLGKWLDGVKGRAHRLPSPVRLVVQQGEVHATGFRLPGLATCYALTLLSAVGLVALWAELAPARDAIGSAAAHIGHSRAEAYVYLG